MRCLAWSLALLAACGSSSPPPARPPAAPVAAPAAPTAPTAPTAPPVAAVRPVTDRYHGVDVADPYRWLEGDDAEVAAWSAGQDQVARRWLAARPQRATLEAEYRAIIAAPTTRYGGFAVAGGRVFASRKLPDKQQRDLVVMASPEDAAASVLVFDPTASGDAHAAIDWFVPSPDGTRVAVSVSQGGSEAGTLHVIGLDGRDLEPPIPDVQRGTGGGDVAWRPDGKAFWYTRYPAAGERPEAERDFWMHVRLHVLGTPAAEDRVELQDELPKIAEVKLAAAADGRVLATVQDGDGGTFRHYLRDGRGRWTRLTDWGDGVVAMTLGPRGTLWMVSTAGAPRGRVLRLAKGATRLAAAKVIVPESADAIVTDFADELGVVLVDDRLVVTYQQGGPTTLRAFGSTGAPAPAPTLPAVAAVYVAPDPLGHDLLVWTTSYVTPPAWSRYTPATGALAPLPALSPPPPVSLDGWEVRRELATSKDGTPVPLNIVWKTGAPQDGTTPCVVTGYGGYGISQTPFFAASVQPLLRRGLCFVDVNLRGGSEFGEAWHRAGALTHKQNVFDDFAAALAYLVAQGYTRPERLAIQGGSNGGLLMGAMLTQHPTAMAAVVSQVGIYDMLRVELSPNGLFNTTEFGTVADRAQFEAMYAYSPYHHVTAGTRYPAVLMTTGANDPRVSPWQSRKMVAALQAAQAGDQPILLTTSATAGHGAGTAMDEQIAQRAELAAFVLDRLGVK
ncbi:MAG: S9 family peptidase [Myxococcales bacterium]|nr:S9 family peptidase [Myxococcales bacterium]